MCSAVGRPRDVIRRDDTVGDRRTREGGSRDGFKNSKLKRPDVGFEEAEWARVRSWTDGALNRLAEPAKSLADQERKDAVRENLRAAAPLVAVLQEHGIPLKEIGELGNVRLAYPTIVDLLLQHLEKPYPEGVKLALIQALARPYGNRAFNDLVDFLLSKSKDISEQMKFQLGLAIAANASRAEFPRLLAVVGDPSNGQARDPIVTKLARWKIPEAAKTIIGYFEEGVNPWAAITALRLAGIWTVADGVRPYLNSKEADYRSVARSYMKTYEKACR